jgi:hypothetical protein
MGGRPRFDPINLEALEDMQMSGLDLPNFWYGDPDPGMYPRSSQFSLHDNSVTHITTTMGGCSLVRGGSGERVGLRQPWRRHECGNAEFSPQQPIH